MKKDLFLIVIFFILYEINSQHIKISAIGDIMAHDTLQYYAITTENKYLTLFESTKFIFLNDDLTIGNLETPVCDNKPIRNYPLFNAKHSLITGLKLAGIDIVSTANNHSLDQGKEGVLSTIESLKKENILFSGTGENPENAKKPLIFLSNGIVIGFIAATFSINGIPYKEEKNTPSINYFKDTKEDIENFCNIIKEYSKIVDIMIVSYHCGIEYESTPLKYHEEIYKKFADSGACVVLIHHPHVLQKIEYYKTIDNRETLIAYSLGNFISAQARYPISFNSKDKEKVSNLTFTKTAEGIILQFEVSKWNNRYHIINARIIPIFNIRFKTKIDNKIYNGFEVVPIQYILEGKYNKRIKDGINESILELVQYRLEKIKKLIKIEILELK